MVLFLQIASVFVNAYIAFTTNTKRLYWANFLFNALNMAIYAYMRDWPTVLSYVGITTRSYAYIYKNRFRTNALPVIFCLFHIVTGLAVLQNPWQVCTVIAPCVLCISMWFFKGRFQALRIGNMLNAGLWLVYNLFTGIYLIAALRVLAILANATAYIRASRREERTP